jgi:predicted nucleic acid-binding protein
VSYAPPKLRDTLIAGIVLARRASLAIRNVAHFSDISAAVVNPWDVGDGYAVIFY